MTDPVETLSQKQQRFARMIPALLSQAFALGFEATLGDAFRDPRVFGELGVMQGYGQAKSCHKLRLAIDLNLFKDGAFLSATSDHLPLGEWWESQGGSWGGRFQDGNHYSLEHEGMR